MTITTITLQHIVLKVKQEVVNTAKGDLHLGDPVHV